MSATVCQKTLPLRRPKIEPKLSPLQRVELELVLGEVLVDLIDAEQKGS